MKKAAFFIALAAVLGYGNAQAVDWNWKGDIRYRYESKMTDDDNEATEDHSRDRHRIRVRFGVNPWINEELSAGLQLATGSEDDPVSRNETLGDFFGGDTILLNEAYIDYHPMFLDGDVNVILGKRAAKSTLIVMDDLVWDGDVTLEGAALQYGKDAKGKEKDGLAAVAGYFPLNEVKKIADGNTHSEIDGYVAAFQAAYKGEMSGLGYQVGASYIDYVNLDYSYTEDPEFSYADKDFNIVEFFGNVSGKISSLPWKLYGQYAFNTAEKNDWSAIDEDERDAMMVGLKLGKAKKPGQVEGAVEYVRIEQDAVTFLTDSDRNDGSSTNLEGVKIGAKYALIQNMTLGATYMNFSPIMGDDENDTNHLLQLDAVVKF